MRTKAIPLMTLIVFVDMVQKYKIKEGSLHFPLSNYQIELL